MPSNIDRRSEEARVESGWLALVGLLLVARYLRPENAQFGDTLWISGLWMALTTLWFWQRARRGAGSLRFGALEIGAIGLTVAHALSTIPVFLEGGDRRGAVNVVWEWAGLAASVILIRQMADTALLRRLMLMFAAVSAALAGLGVWQHHVSIPDLAERYAELRAQEQSLADSATDPALLSAVRDELAAFDAPVDETARIRWENRLRHSTEPFATFALANTLAGLLAAGLPVLVMASAAGSWSWRRWVAIGAALLVLYCLILTKSRTAWAGLAIGTILGIGWLLLRHGPSIRPGWLTAGLLVIVAAGFVTVGATGGLDREVLSEAPKSLQYRLEYWEGALAVLGEHPWLGTGPANFRSYYMQHRPIGASEAIAAPHNLFLEIWSAGGLLALLLLIGLLGFAGLRLLGAARHGFETFPNDQASSPRAFYWGGLAAFFVVALVYFATGAAIDWRLVGMAPIFFIVAIALDPGRESRLPGVGLMAGLIALVVHLLGADGIEFPVVIQSLFLFAIVADGPGKLSANARHNAPAGRGVVWALAAGCGLLTVGLLLTGLAPVLNSSAHLLRATSLATTGRPGAEQAVDAAIEADPWSLRPLMMKAELATSRSLANESTRDRNRAVAAWRDVLAADPRNVFARRRIADLLMAGARERENAELAGEAAAVMREAVVLSPTEVDLWREFARALRIAGRHEAAAQAAGRALALNEVNQQRGHIDLLLDEAAQNELRRWKELGQAGDSP